MFITEAARVETDQSTNIGGGGGGTINGVHIRHYSRVMCVNRAEVRYHQCDQYK
jgi:hypothetical protein